MLGVSGRIHVELLLTVWASSVYLAHSSAHARRQPPFDLMELTVWVSSI
jgi:hypothetical protein